MIPIKTPSTNGQLLPAKGTEDHVSVLPITRTEDHVSSCWKMSWKERVLVLLTGRIWFDCAGVTHPAIRLRVT